MTTFPTLYPNSFSFGLGLPQVSEFTSFGVGPIRFRHNNFINGQRFALEYLNLQQTSVEAIRNHYSQNQGTAGEFLVPSAIFGSVNIIDSASVFRYVETPVEEHFGIYFNVIVTIEAVTGIELLFSLEGGPATLPAEEAFSKFVFDGTAPFILNGSDPALATLTLNAD
jgi:hypothetical protein